jgi:hypothetical protein
MVAQFAACLRDKVLGDKVSGADAAGTAGETSEAKTETKIKTEAAPASGFGILFGALGRWLKSLFGRG